MLIEYHPNEAFRFAAAGCFCLCENDLLIIKRQRGKPFADHWAVPTGKLEHDERPGDAIVRELDEEVGLAVKRDQLIQISDVVVQNAQSGRFRYTSFVLFLDRKPEILIRTSEISRYEWASLDRLRKRRVVPFFWNTIRDLNTWLDGRYVQPRLFPTPQGLNSHTHF